ncbi:MAG: threonine synthase, partial [Desulfocapsa sp.]|nr:threonine synthase [Desulfocapsa sp.]
EGNPNRRLTFSVPTGNFGDIFAGYIAMRMGLPVDRLVLATNRNDILSRFVNSGVYEALGVHHTVSPSMDIQISSNFERYLYYLMDDDPAKVRELMDNMARDGRLEVSEEKQRRVRKLFQARAVGETETLEQIRITYRYSNYILDPHTAVGVHCALKHQEQGIPICCLATAHPGKFGDTVENAIQTPLEYPDSIKELMDPGKASRCEFMDADKNQIQDFIKSHSTFS